MESSTNSEKHKKNRDFIPLKNETIILLGDFSMKKQVCEHHGLNEVFSSFSILKKFFGF
jgi:hypothetical protein